LPQARIHLRKLLAILNTEGCALFGGGERRGMLPTSAQKSLIEIFGFF
jgi:hypothetical protein